MNRGKNMVIYFVMFMVLLVIFIAHCVISDNKAKKYFAPGGAYEHNRKFLELQHKVMSMNKPEITIVKDNEVKKSMTSCADADNRVVMTVDEYIAYKKAYKKAVEELENFATKR